MGKTRCKPEVIILRCADTCKLHMEQGSPDGHTDVRLVDFCRKNCISNKKKPQRSTSTWLEDAGKRHLKSRVQHFISDNSNAEIIIEITNIYVSASIKPNTLFSISQSNHIHIAPIL